MNSSEDLSHSTTKLSAKPLNSKDKIYQLIEKNEIEFMLHQYILFFCRKRKKLTNRTEKTDTEKKEFFFRIGDEKTEASVMI